MKSGARAVSALLGHALGYPEAWEDSPWGERVAKVGKKVFVFAGVPSAGVTALSVKLPDSHEMALGMPFVTPTGYGLGKSGWVTARFESGDDVPLEMLQAWIDESYRAIAPKKRLAALDGAPAKKTAKKAVKKRARAV